MTSILDSLPIPRSQDGPQLLALKRIVRDKRVREALQSFKRKFGASSSNCVACTGISTLLLNCIAAAHYKQVRAGGGDNLIGFAFNGPDTGPLGDCPTPDIFTPTGISGLLPHGARKDPSTGQRQKLENFGTPTFISVDLVNPSSRKFPKQCLDDLLVQFAGAQRHSAFSSRAFLEGDAEFLAQFKQVMAAERARERPQAQNPPPPSEPDDPRHDVQSIYWVLLWAFSHALPLGSHTDEVVGHNYRSFCFSMLRDDVGGYNRATWLLDAMISGLSHPKLRSSENLLTCMASYLSVPWHAYPNMPAHHVHGAFSRLILSFLSNPKNAAALEVPLDTSTLRPPLNANSATDMRRATGATESGPDVTTGRVRKRKGDANDGSVPSVKRRLTGL
ncbi:hypothetical protein AURDEDRAFT_123719 [Auricularia subglabra TFB-10046 SS5]|nr:hypothetical protein AURDEDRAFT_123719 [Auricularia subglabra TFB-10046 SS5]